MKVLKVFTLIAVVAFSGSALMADSHGKCTKDGKEVKADTEESCTAQGGHWEE